MKVKEVIEKTDTTNYWSFYDFEKAFPELEFIEGNLDVDKHRWFETSCAVYKCEDGFVMVQGVSTMFGEDMEWEDCGFECNVEECFPVQSIRYLTKSEIDKTQINEETK